MLLLGLVFTLVLGLSFGVLALVTRGVPQEKAMAIRLNAILPAAGIDELAPSALLKQSRTHGSTTHLEKSIERFLNNLRFLGWLERVIRQAHRSTTPGKLALQSVAFAAVAFFAGGVFLPGLPLRAGLAAAAGSAPLFLLLRRRSSRLKRFNAGLAEGIDLMSRALRAGHSVASAIEMVAEQGPQPLAAEFGEVFQAQNFGLPFREALLQMVERVPSLDLRILVTAMLVQKETGGNLIEILDRASHVIRERYRIQGEVRTKTAQGRLTGWILIFLPVVLGFLINMINPGYAAPLLHDPLGRKMLYGGIAMVTIGGFIISRIVRIEV